MIRGKDTKIWKATVLIGKMTLLIFLTGVLWSIFIWGGTF